jgi:hypothetical protein
MQVCALVQRELQARGTPAILASPTMPERWDDELYIGMDLIRVLYRFFPIEAMEGQANVPDIAHAVRTGRVRTMSSFASAHAQSKVALARAWDRLGAVKGVPESREVRGMPSDALGDRERWVLKKGFGRVGDEVFVGALCSESEWRELVQWARAESDGWQPWIAQRFVPQRAIETPWGPRLLTLGVYVLDGIPVGYFGRLSVVSLASHDALCVPVLVEGT